MPTENSVSTMQFSLSPIKNYMLILTRNEVTKICEAVSARGLELVSKICQWEIEGSSTRIDKAFRLLVWNELCLTFSAELSDRLEANLRLTGLDGQAICERLSHETATARERRDGVFARMDRLFAAVQKLEQLEGDGSN